MNLDELRALREQITQDPTQIGDDQLAAARDAIAEQVAAAREAGPSPDGVKLLTALLEVKHAVDGEVQARASAAAELDSETQRLLADLDGQADNDEPEDKDAPLGVPADEPELIAASAAQAIGDAVAAGIAKAFAAQNQAAAAPATPPQGRTAKLTTSATVTQPRGNDVITAKVYAGAQVDDGALISDSVTLAKAIHDKWRTSYQAKNYAGRMPIAHVATTYPESRQLGNDAVANYTKLEAATSPQALTAAGLCAPLETLYDVPVIGSAARPVRDQALTRFGVERGGMTYRPSMSAASAVHGAGVWTVADDEAGTGEKACYVVECPGLEEEIIEAIYLCLEFSNITAKFDPETTAANVQQGMVAHSRLGENQLLAKMAAGSKLLTGAKVIGAVRDILVNLDKASAYYRNRHRLEGSLPLTWLAPGWVKSLMRADLARQMAAGDWAEALAPADALINQWFSHRDITPVWHLDGPAGTDEVQTVTITGTPTGGTFTLTYAGQTTDPIAYNATAAVVKAALAELSNVHAEDITVAGGALPGTAVTVTFGGGEYDGSNVPQMTASGAGLTGGSSPAVGVTTTTAGGGALTVQGVSIASQTYGDAAAAGAIPGFPDQIDSLLYTPGSWLFLDGGSLDLGLVRDSTLNAKNRYRQFSETFEGAAFRGVESLRLVMSVQPTGQTGGTSDLSAIAD